MFFWEISKAITLDFFFSGFHELPDATFIDSFDFLIELYLVTLLFLKQISEGIKLNSLTQMMIHLAILTIKSNAYERGVLARLGDADTFN